MVRRFQTDFTRSGASAFYEACKAIDGYRGDGTFNLIAARAYAFYFQADRQPFYEPLTTRDELKAVSDVNYYLLEGGLDENDLDHVTISFRFFESAHAAPGGRLLMPHAGDADRGLHAVAMIGWDDPTDSIVFQNSWGARWGDRGIGYMSREYFERYMNDAWLARRAHIGPIAAKWPRIESARNAREFARIWTLHNPRWRARFKHRGRGHQYAIYETISTAGARVEVIEIRTGYGFRVAWAHVHHLRSDRKDTSVVKELFVWPAFRRLGYGTLLEQAAVDRARMWNSRRLELLLHDVDDFLGTLSPGRKFGEKAGYKWRWGRYLRPNLKAIGVKEL